MLPRLLLAVAMRSLGSRRRTWAQAMLAEFDVAERDGQAFRFALGCLLGAWRMLPRHAEGQFALAGYALACGFFLPMAAMLAMAAIFGFPFVEASDGIHGFLSGSGSYRSQLNAGTLAVGPALTLLMLLLAACHLPLAWWVLERDWRRAGTVLRVAAASMATLAMVTCCAALNAAALLLPFAALTVELAVVGALARFEVEQFGGEAGEGFGTIS
jgi:hypothetical protein